MDVSMVEVGKVAVRMGDAGVRMRMDVARRRREPFVRVVVVAVVVAVAVGVLARGM
jgi:hypothetical protein